MELDAEEDVDFSFLLGKVFYGKAIAITSVSKSVTCVLHMDQLQFCVFYVHVVVSMVALFHISCSQMKTLKCLLVTLKDEVF